MNNVKEDVLKRLYEVRSGMWGRLHEKRKPMLIRDVLQATKDSLEAYTSTVPHRVNTVLRQDRL